MSPAWRSKASLQEPQRRPGDREAWHLTACGPPSLALTFVVAALPLSVLVFFHLRDGNDNAGLLGQASR